MPVNFLSCVVEGVVSNINKYGCMTQGINMLGFSCYSRSVYECDVENHSYSGKELVVGLFLCFFP